MTNNLKGSHYPKHVILYALFFYARYAVSCRDLEEVMAERGVEVDHANMNRWVVRYAPLIAKLTKQMKGFKSFRSASATLDGIEVAHMIRKRQFGPSGQPAFQKFAELAG